MAQANNAITMVLPEAGNDPAEVGLLQQNGPIPVIAAHAAFSAYSRLPARCRKLDDQSGQRDQLEVLPQPIAHGKDS